MKALVLGGTGFVGRAIAECAVTRGHDVTVFNRGLRGAPPAGTRLITGDRTNPADLDSLAAMEWDAVIDCPVMAPEVVAATATRFAERVEEYALVSTIGVYADPTSGPSEQSPVKVWSRTGPAGLTGEFYGNDGAYQSLKAGCEQVVREQFPDALITRPGTIVGPHEDKGRLPYWILRAAQGGPMLAPGRPERPLQLIDARDLAQFMVRNLENHQGGTFNVMSRPGITTTQGLLSACIDATGSDAELVWVDESVIMERHFNPSMCPPIWLPERPPYARSLAADTSKAFEHGLECRPIESTVTDTWEWLQGLGGQLPRREDMSELAGIPPELERQLLLRVGVTT